MEEQSLQILELVAEGRLTVDQAVALIAALREIEEEQIFAVDLSRAPHIEIYPN